MRPINPIDHDGAIQLKFSYGGKRYGFNPIPSGHYSNKRDLATAKAIATRISDDILAGCFDKSLSRYRLTPRKLPETKPETWLFLWDGWVKSLDLPLATLAAHYKVIRSSILKANPRPQETSWFTSSTLAGSTYNSRLGYLKACGKWAMSKGLLAANPYAGLKPRKTIKPVTQPFSKAEIAKILQGFRDYAPSYAPFVSFLFQTGVRTSEAIGLRWGHVDFDRGLITISESLSRDRTGNGYQKVRKSTKSGNVRQLPMSKPLRALLLNMQPLESPESGSLVFLSPQSAIIDPNNFRERYWKPVLTKVKVSYRKPYTSRHTMISHAIEQGCPLTGLAYLAGHTSTRMIMDTYGHMVNLQSLPKMPI